MAIASAYLRVDVARVVPVHRLVPASGSWQDVGLSIHNNMGSVAADWRAFEQIADCTAFQTFDWLATWHRHIGQRTGVIPAIVIGRCADGKILFLLPLAKDSEHIFRRIAWLGQDLCDYNAPLLARDFSRCIAPGRFLTMWQEIRDLLQCDPLLRHDWIELEKMPEMVGPQSNPFFHLDVTLNPSGAYLTQLGSDWEKFYAAKRSAATRRRDRTKCKRLSEYGEIRFVNAADENDTASTLDTLMRQKRQSLARMGVADIFAQPGHREFFLDLATNPRMRNLIHVSRLEIGTTPAATNLGLTFRDCYYHVLASYDGGELSRFGPGAAHLRDLLRHAIGLGLRRFDFTIGDEPYKREWCDTTLRLYDHVAAATWRGRQATLWSVVRRWMKRFIKQTPFVWHSFIQVRSVVGSLLSACASRLAPSGKPTAGGAHPPPALACVMGDMDLLRPIALAGIPCTVITRPGVPSLYSRFTQSSLCWDDFSENVEELVDALVRFGAAQPERPVLFYEEDAQLLLVSRYRERLARAFRFVVADAALVEELVDKARFQALAERLCLPVPTTRRFHPAGLTPADLGLRFPVIIKPLTRLEPWNDTWGLRKALHAETPDALRSLWPRLVAMGIDLLAQELIPGPEERIESYHVYVDERGDIAGEFTGRKIRTYPVSYGHTTALVITDAADVTKQGRAIVHSLNLRGVAKLDFKRGPDGKLYLLEVNPRFNLWHHPAAIAGVNLPALVYADLVGLPRPITSRAHVGVRWCRIWKDLPAARACGVPLTTWLPWALRCEAKSALSWDDPIPLVRATLFRLFSRFVGRETSRRGRNWVGS